MKTTIPLLIGAALSLPITTGHANAWPASNMAQELSRDGLPVVNVHSLHTSCLRGSVSPSGQGNPITWHKTAEAGVHTGCTPPRKGAGKLTIKPGSGANRTGGTGALSQ